VVRVSDLGSKGPGFDPRVVPKSECMFVNLPLLSCVLYYIMCLIVVLVCKIVNLQH